MKPSNVDLSGLSRQEERVLFLAINGLTDKEIAAEMHVSSNTVRTYWDRIRHKTGSDNRQKLISAMIESGAVEILESDRLTINSLSMELESLRAELAAVKLELEYSRILLDNLPVMALLIRGVDEIVYANRPLLEYTGKESRRLQSKDLIEFMHPDDLSSVDAQIGLKLSMRQPFELRFRFRNHKGEYHKFRYIATFSTDAPDSSVRTGMFVLDES